MTVSDAGWSPHTSAPATAGRHAGRLGLFFDLVVVVAVNQPHGALYSNVAAEKCTCGRSGWHRHDGGDRAAQLGRAGEPVRGGLPGAGVVAHTRRWPLRAVALPLAAAVAVPAVAAGGPLWSLRASRQIPSGT